MKMKKFLTLCALTLVFGCIGYADWSIIGTSLDSGGLWIFAAVIAFLNLIGIGYWIAVVSDPIKCVKLPKIVNLTILISTLATMTWSTVELYSAGQLVFPVIMSILVVCGGLYLFYWARKQRKEFENIEQFSGTRVNPIEVVRPPKKKKKEKNPDSTNG